MLNEESVKDDARDLESRLADPASRAERGRPIDRSTWAGGIPVDRAKVPEVRIGRGWVSTLWLIPITVVGLLLMIAIAQELREYSWMQSFIDKYPGTSSSYVPKVDGGFPWWLRWQHLFNALFMMFIIRAGWQILADHPRLYLNADSTPDTDWLRLRGPIPADRRDPTEAKRIWTAKDDSTELPKWLGLPGIRHSIGLARWWHFSFDLLWVINGVLFFVLIFATGQWERLVPTSFDVFPNALSTAVQYASLNFPANEGFHYFNGLQIIAYFVTIFIAAPLALITGLLQAPTIAAKFGTGHGPFNRQVARTVHFCVMAWMVFFIAVHTVMVFVTGLIGNLNHITLGTNTQSYWALLIYVAAMALVVFLWAKASPFTLRHPDKVQRVGAFMVGRIKGLMEWANPGAEYREKDISPYLWPNGTVPEDEIYDRMKADDWAGWSLEITGLVEKPVTLTYKDVLAMPKSEQITQHFCIQGWSGIAKWGGVRMEEILRLVEPKPEAKWVVFYSFAWGAEGPEGGKYYDCHKIEHMHHEHTILAYEMNDEPLLESHGAPLRLRNENELGFKQVKWINAIEFVESFDHLGEGQGGFNEDHEYYGYRMPI